MSGTKTGAALFAQEALQSSAPIPVSGQFSEPSISPELLAELVKKAFQFAPRQQP
jgi:hypothetical protein